MIKPLWPCSVTISAHMPNGRKRSLTVKFDGDNGDIKELADQALRNAIKKPWLWYGVEYQIRAPFHDSAGIKLTGIFEP